MQNLSVKLASSLTFALATFGFSTFAEKVNAATIVDLELGLIIDASDSINDNEFDLQRDAYQSVFTNENFYKQFIEPGDKKQIAVSAFIFGGDVRQEIGWTLIDSQNASTNFGNAFENITRSDATRAFTDTDGAIATAANSIVSNNFDAKQQTLDISTDGLPTEQGSLAKTPGEVIKKASQDALNSGVDAINAIGIISRDGINRQYLEDFVIGGENGNKSDAFVLTANDFDEFAATLESKIQREIITQPKPPGQNTGAVPEPSIMVGILAAGVMRHRLAKHLKRQKK
jgi:hypothetical protein